MWSYCRFVMVPDPSLYLCVRETTLLPSRTLCCIMPNMIIKLSFQHSTQILWVANSNQLFGLFISVYHHRGVMPSSDTLVLEEIL